MRGKTADDAHAGQRQRAELRFSAARQHHIGMAAPQHFGRFANRLRARSTRHHHRAGIAFRVEVATDVMRGHVGQQAHHVERRHLHRPALDQRPGRILRLVHRAAKGRAHQHAHPLAIDALHIEVGIAHGLHRRRHGQLRKARHAARFTRRQIVLRLETLHAAGHLARKTLIGRQPAQSACPIAR